MSDVSPASAKNTPPKDVKRVSVEERGQKAKDQTEDIVTGVALDIFRKAAEESKLQPGVITKGGLDRGTVV